MMFDACSTAKMVRSLSAILGLLFAFLPELQGDEFPPLRNTDPGNATPMGADEAAATMQLPPGFKATVFAAEPDVQNPIAMAWDQRGRLWIAENYTYAERTQRFDLSLRDRVLIFEDVDGDGRAESRKVFTDQVQMLTSVEVGRNGVWLMCPPQLLFMPDANGDDRPDGPVDVVLDGFDVAQDNYHNFATGLRWGPDGWLYGRCGHSCPGKVGVPGTPNDERIPLEGGIWRFHPEKKIFEALAHGTTNPWGHDWDQHGELFFINTVIGHLWHMIPGSHFKESFGESINPHVYERMDMIADHYHFDTKGKWMDSRDGKANDLGGGHAHVGMMIYQDQVWPDKYRNRLMTINMHGMRINVERLDRTNSGYVGRHEPDLLISKDPFFRGTDLSVGPDGNVFLIDWSDTGECHEHTGVHRTSGRIFKIAYHEAIDGTVGSSAIAAAKENKPFLQPGCLNGDGPLPDLWRRYQAGEVTQSQLLELTHHPDEHVRVWSVRLLTDLWPLDLITGPRQTIDIEGNEVVLSRLKEMASNDNSGLVARVLLSTMQRLPIKERAAIAQAIVTREELVAQAELGLLAWYGLIPVGQTDPKSLVEIATASKWPVLTKMISRYLGSRMMTQPVEFEQLLEVASTFPQDCQVAVLDGLYESMRGVRQVKKPKGWELFSQQEIIKANTNKVQQLSLIFGSGRALEELRKTALDGGTELGIRSQALQALIDARPDDLRAICEKLLEVRVLNVTALRGLSLFNDNKLTTLIIRKYRSFQPEDRGNVLQMLVSREESASLLLDEFAKENSSVPVRDLTASQARQIDSLAEEVLSRKLREVWGDLGSTNEEIEKAIRDLKSALTPAALSAADRSHGRVLFNKSCSNCHTLFGTGVKVGPDLTGAQRSSLDYLLENMLNPSAVVGKEFRMTIVRTTDGRVLNGLVVSQDGQRLVLQTATEQIVLAADELEETKPTSKSAMPDGLLQALNDEEVRDLVAYLMSPVQVELPSP